MKADRVIADQVLQDIADYVIDYKVESEEALNTARNCLIDTIGCGLMALKFPSCTRHLGPLVPGTTCLLYTSPSPRDATLSRMPSSA